ncbi:helix-turn-helix domain-containing protein [Deefgea sp. CFH1-16]|uniref:helix-turn-helix domain-containing protein n=1 Tax=Deefgea sp. CFH1-16 TaxID=2675457 RepID=UPI0015F67683|nr:helix-turn-helix domain-containing protein [Deefgea sp. CFH1-16]MBM5575319.1 hypothetical protein [Deefgea sp. CFH1-16]
MNVSIHIVGRLIKSQLLGIMGARTHTTGIGRLIPLNGIRAFLATLAPVVVERDDFAELRCVSYIQFGLDFEPRINLLTQVKTGQAWVSSYDSACGLPSLVVVAPFAKKSESQGFSIAEVAAQLDIYTDAIYRVVKAGLLKHTNVAHRQYRINEQDFHEFNCQYVFVREIASKYSCNPTNLADKLRSAGIVPVHGPSIDNGLVYLFKRSDLESINIQEIVAARKYASTAGRRPLLTNKVGANRQI